MGGGIGTRIKVRILWLEFHALMVLGDLYEEVMVALEGINPSTVQRWWLTLWLVPIFELLLLRPVPIWTS